MKKPVAGGLVSSLVFVLGCNNASSPTDAAGGLEVGAAKETCTHAPQVLFDPETGRMTIVSDELSQAIRAHLDIGDAESGEREATLVFRARIRKAGPDSAGLTSDMGDEDINLGC